jgi:hypothetical protein
MWDFNFGIPSAEVSPQGNGALDEKGQILMNAQMRNSPEELLRKYKEGRITANGLILNLLNLTGKRRLINAL